jgi:hypothetical protein
MFVTYASSLLPTGIQKVNIIKMSIVRHFSPRPWVKLRTLHSSHELPLCLPIKITERDFIMTNNILGTEELNRKQSNITK